MSTAEQITAEITEIITETLKLNVTAEAMPLDDLCAMWDAIQAAQDADLGESPTTLRSYLLP